jgi:hypothetical protein
VDVFVSSGFLLFDRGFLCGYFVSWMNFWVCKFLSFYVCKSFKGIRLWSVFKSLWIFCGIKESFKYLVQLKNVQLSCVWTRVEEWVYNYLSEKKEKISYSTSAYSQQTRFPILTVDCYVVCVERTLLLASCVDCLLEKIYYSTSFLDFGFLNLRFFGVFTIDYYR